MEAFRGRKQGQCEGLMLDDPLLGNLNAEQLKSWFDLKEAGSGEARYSDAKFCANAPRALLTNEINYEAEPGKDEPFLPKEIYEC